MSTPIKGWGDIHAAGETPKPWNIGMRARAPREHELARTEARRRERRRRDVERALGMGVSAEFTHIAFDYLHKRGQLSNG